jgi:hypothetical protein
VGTVHDGILTVKKAPGVGNIETRRKFHNYQLHVEWRIPENITGSSQARGNSGVFLASTGPGDAGYELQVLDSYNNKTYVNGMAGSMYKQSIPLANPMRKPGEWNIYDVAWTAPTFNADGSLKSPAYVTVFLNGVLVDNHFELKGETLYIGKPFYKAFDSAPIKLQAHGDKSEPLSIPQHLGPRAAVNAGCGDWEGLGSRVWSIGSGLGTSRLRKNSAGAGPSRFESCRESRKNWV